MLILRHRRKSSTSTAVHVHEEHGGEKADRQEMYQRPGSELATSSNVWEMEASGKPGELEVVPERKGEDVVEEEVEEEVEKGVTDMGLQ
jgi:hypothetical protein